MSTPSALSTPSAPSAPWAMKRWPGPAAVIVLVLLIAYQFVDNRAELAVLRQLSLGLILAALVLQFLYALCFNEATRAPFAAVVKDLGFCDFYIVGTGGSLLGGLVAIAGNIAGGRWSFRKRLDSTCGRSMPQAGGSLASVSKRQATPEPVKRSCPRRRGRPCCWPRGGRGRAPSRRRIRSDPESVDGRLANDGVVRRQTT